MGISSKKIAHYLQGQKTGLAVEMVEKTASTNSDLLNRVATLTAPMALVAREQTAGRGRAGRAWHSASGASLTFSVAWPFHSIQALTGLPLVVGVAIVNALQVFDVQTTLKWPNDILKDWKKLGGVLVETSKVDDRVWAVIGIGLNLQLPEELEQQIEQPVASAPWLAEMDHSQLIAGLLESLALVLAQFDKEGFVPFMPAWTRYHAHQGKQVALFDAEHLQYEGVAKGIDSHGRLLLDTMAGVIAVSSGDVSLRIKE